MVAQSARAAIAHANAYSSCQQGMCLKYVHVWLEIPAMYASAAEAWMRARDKHPGDQTAPAGVPVFWTGGSQGYGHIALSVGGGKCRSTDVPSAGRVATVEIDWITEHWGQKYMGWTEDLNGVTIPYADRTLPNDAASGIVYVEKLHRGQTNSDSVRRLRYRLNGHSQMPAGRRPGLGAGYGIKVVNAVKYYQTTIAPKTPGPKDGSSMSNQQANQLFGPAYKVVTA